MKTRKARISQLERSIQTLGTQVETLILARLGLRRNDYLLRLTVAHHAALLRLGELLAAQGRPLPWVQHMDELFAPLLTGFAVDGAPATDTDASSNSSSDSAPHHQQQQQQHPLLRAASSRFDCSSCAEAAPERWCHWSPEDAAAAAADLDLSVHGVAAKTLDFVQEAGCLLPRVQLGAPDAPAAAARLERAAADFVLLILLAAVHDRSTLPSLVLAPLGGKPPASGTRPPGDAHWEWAAAQLELDAEQVDLVLSALDMWAARAKRRAASRQLLMAACAAGAGAGGLGEDADEARAARGAMLEEVDALMWASMLDAAATWLTVFDSIVRPLQHARYMLACAPWVPPLVSLQRSLRSLRERKAGGGATGGGGGGVDGGRANGGSGG